MGLEWLEWGTLRVGLQLLGVEGLTDRIRG